MSTPTPPKTNPVFFSFPADFDSWPKDKQQEWAEKQAAVIIDKLKPAKK